MEIVRLIIGAGCLLAGMFMFVMAAIGVYKYRHALYRIHTAALGDTLGLLFVVLGLIIWKGFSFVSLKLFFVVVFFWLASPVAGHMIARLVVETDEEVGEIEVEKK